MVFNWNLHVVQIFRGPLVGEMIMPKGFMITSPPTSESATTTVIDEKVCWTFLVEHQLWP